MKSIRNKRKLKVLLVSPYSPRTVGGIGTWTKTILDYGENEDELQLMFLNTFQGFPKRWAANKRLFYWIIGIVDSFLILVRLLFRMLLSRPNVVHYTSSAGSALYKDLIACRIVGSVFKKKFVIHWHFGRIPIICKEKGREYRLLVRVCKLCDLSITIDRQSNIVLQKEHLRSVFVPNPIPISLQKESEKYDSYVKIDRNKRDVLFVGHVLQTKGIIELVQACADCDEVDRLIVVGPFFDEELKSRVIGLSQVRDNGNWLRLVGEKAREEVWNYYKRCSIFCLPSYTEGFPFVVLEAMAFGCPIVATKVGAIPDMLADSCGVLVDSHDKASLNEALSELLLNFDQAREMGQNAHVKVLNCYTVEKVFSEYYDLWK